MNGEASLLLASGLISLTAHSINCWGKRRKQKKLYKTKLSALIISKKCGKSCLKEKLQSVKSNLHIVDMNEVVSGKDELEYLEKGKEYVDNLIKKHPKKNFLLLINSKDEARHFGVDEANSFVVAPSIKLFNSIKAKCKEQSPELLHLVEQERLKLIRDTESDKLNVFETFTELEDVIKREYKLQSNF